MGLFPRYDHEGRGVQINEPKRGVFAQFFHTYHDKFFKILTTNLMFILFNIPAFIITFLCAIFYLPQINPVFAPDTFLKYLSTLGIMLSDKGASADGGAVQIYFLLVVFVAIFVVGMQLVTVGPVQTGLSYIYRNYARESATFLWSDFTSAFKSNWKQATAAAGISVAVSGIFLANIIFYVNVYSGKFSQVFSTLFVVLFVFFMCIQMYVFPMIASVKLKLVHIYKNAILFFLARFIPTMGIILVNVLILLLIPVALLFIFTNIGFALLILYYGFFAFGFTQYLNTFFVWQQILRYIVKPQEDIDPSPEAS